MTKYPTYKILICPICGEQAPYGWLKKECSSHGKSYIEIEVRPTSDPKLRKETQMARDFYHSFEKHPEKLLDNSFETLHKIVLVYRNHPHQKDWGKEKLVAWFDRDIKIHVNTKAQVWLKDFSGYFCEEETEELKTMLYNCGRNAVLNAGFRKKDFSKSSLQACVEKAKQDIAKYMKYDESLIMEHFCLYEGWEDENR